jgi:hypothetical protein
VILARAPRRRTGRSAVRRAPGGAATVAVSIAALVAVGTAGLVVGAYRKDPEAASSEEGIRARSIAEAAISAKISQMVAGNFTDLGSSGHGVPLAGGSAWVGVENFDVRRELFRLTAQASYQGETQVVEAVLRPVVERAPVCAVFAGNASNDPDYVLDFGGEGEISDSILGDVYSGSSIRVRGAARIQGTLRARRGIDGAEGDAPAARRAPDFGGFLRARRPSDRARVLRVDALFARETREPGPAGGGRVPCDNPAHVFRKNPPDRVALTDTTPGDDYFLEDVCADGEAGGAADDEASWVRVAEAEGAIGERGSSATFVLDGDLWIASRSGRPIRFGRPGGQATNLSIVVRGNIHVGASLLDPQGDVPAATGAAGRRNAIALVALRHEDREASGDIVFEGEGVRAAEEIDAFLFAERDIRRAEGERTTPLLVRGALIAGNQIRFGSRSARAPLAVLGDERLADGTLAAAGIPVPPDRATAFSVISWRALGAP